MPLFEAMGKTIVHQGPAGAGQHTKMVNQILIATNMIGVCEALLYGYKAGLDLETVLQSVGSGAAGLVEPEQPGPADHRRQLRAGLLRRALHQGHGRIALAAERGTGAAGSWSLNNLGPRIIAGNFDPGFFVEHFLKDMGIALAEARRMKLALPGLALAEQLYRAVEAHGDGRKGTQALMLALAGLSEVPWKGSSSVS